MTQLQQQGHVTRYEEGGGPLVNSDEHASSLFFNLSGTSPFLPPEGVLNPPTSLGDGGRFSRLAGR